MPLHDIEAALGTTDMNGVKTVSAHKSLPMTGKEKKAADVVALRAQLKPGTAEEM